MELMPLQAFAVSHRRERVGYFVYLSLRLPCSRGSRTLDDVLLLRYEQARGNEEHDAECYNIR
jgi:hypothetical protein